MNDHNRIDDTEHVSRKTRKLYPSEGDAYHSLYEYCNLLNIHLSVEDMKKISKKATHISNIWEIPVKVKSDAVLGTINTFRRYVLDVTLTELDLVGDIAKPMKQEDRLDVGDNSTLVDSCNKFCEAFIDLESRKSDPNSEITQASLDVFKEAHIMMRTLTDLLKSFKK